MTILHELFDIPGHLPKKGGEQTEDPAGREPDWQKVAAALALKKRLLIISGGPGTGKTTTVARMIRLLEAALDRPLRIALTAPTGKAAARMNQALELGLKGSGGRKAGDSDGKTSRGPGVARTLHRLLNEVRSTGMLPPEEKQRLFYDLIILDEASMVDQGMMYRLLKHLDSSTRLILLGDRDQLSSVEAGAVLGDICTKRVNGFSRETARYLGELGLGDMPELTGETGPAGLADSVVYLTRSHRFDSDSGISTLAAAVNSRRADQASEILTCGRYPDLAFSGFRYERQDLLALFRSAAGSVAEAAKLHDEDLIAFWNRSIWLGVLRRGPFGTDSLNREIEQYLLAGRFISPAGGWYHGRPVLVTRNDYSLGIFNGDLGVCAETAPGAGTFQILFSTPSGTLKKIPVHRLRHFEPAFLLTVHKSQGSEFDAVNLLLPPRDTPVLTSELIYTALTRARSRFHLFGDIELFGKGVGRRTERFTGLRQRLHSS